MHLFNRIILTFLLFGSVLLANDKLTTFLNSLPAAPEDKAVIYFARLKGTFVPARVHHGEREIIMLFGDEFYRYECEPGKHLFWSQTGKASFLNAEVEAGKIYLIDIYKGGEFRPIMNPIKGFDEKQLKKFHKVF